MNRELIGKEFVASLNPINKWVKCSEGNDGEENYYMEVYDNYGRLVYCEDERCELVGIDRGRNNVELHNVSDDEGFESFTISIEQFCEDFVECVQNV